MEGEQIVDDASLRAWITDFLGYEWWGGVDALWGLLVPVIGAVWTLLVVIKERRKQRRVNEALSGPGAARLRARRDVVGRDAAVADLRRMLTADGRSAITPVATGIGGAGKTTLAQHYAQTYSGDYAKQRMLRAETEASLVADLALFGRDLDRNLTQLQDIAAAKVTLQMIEDRSQSEPWLLIYDNAEKPETLEPWMARGSQCHVLVTSRFPDWPGYTPLELATLSSPAAVQLLRNEATRDDPGFPELAETLGFLPLALVQAGEWLRDNRRVTAAAYQADIVNLRKRSPLPGMTAEADRTTAAVVEKTLGLLTKDARTLLDILAWWAPEGLGPELFEGMDKVPGFLLWWFGATRAVRRLVKRPDRIDAAFRELRLRALLEEDENGTYRLHRVFSLVVREQVKLRGSAGFRRARAASALLRSVYPGGAKSPENPDHWPECRRLTPHGLALWRAAADLWDGPWGKPGWAAMDVLLNQIGIYLFAQEDLRGALAAARASLSLKEARLSETDQDFTVALGAIGLYAAQAGEFAEAEGLLDRALALDARDRAGSAKLAARLRQRAGLELDRFEAAAAGRAVDRPADLEAALGWLQEARGYEETRAKAGRSEDLARTWNDIGYLHRLAGRAKDAAAGYEAARAALPDGANRVAVATCAMNAGAARLEAGQPEAAEPLLQEAYEVREVIHAQSPGHPARRKAASWYVSCVLVLDRKDGTGEREAKAQGIAAAVGLEWDEELRAAAQYPTAPPA